ncbi:MAG: hypothetical protein EPN43_01925 [Jatrophihabitans sp.]|nr:MAG: hypothetical protein EPN43_01925 [Jatrophihabitans sp.]
MATSLEDLTNTLILTVRTGTDHEDAAAALGWTARLIGNLRAEGALRLTDRPRDLAAERLQDACQYAAMSFGGNEGRVAVLTAVASDLAARLRDRLSEEDRWATTTRAAMSARHCARALAGSGPHGATPELVVVTEGAREVLALAGLRPLRHDKLRAFDGSSGSEV